MDPLTSLWKNFSQILLESMPILFLKSLEREFYNFD